MMTLKYPEPAIYEHSGGALFTLSPQGARRAPGDTSAPCEAAGDAQAAPDRAGQNDVSPAPGGTQQQRGHLS